MGFLSYALTVCFVLVSVPVVSAQTASPMLVAAGSGKVLAKSQEMRELADENRRYYFNEVSWAGSVKPGTREKIKALIMKYRSRFLLLEEVDEMCSGVRKILHQDNGSDKGSSCAIHKSVLTVMGDAR